MPLRDLANAIRQREQVAFLRDRFMVLSIGRAFRESMKARKRKIEAAARELMTIHEVRVNEPASTGARQGVVD